MRFIKKIRIKNFKSLEDVEIEVKPLTFFFGPNSSGKSSFLKAIMFFSKNLFPLNTGRTIYKLSDDVDLGSFKDIVINNDVTKKIVFEIDIEGIYEFPTFDIPDTEDEEYEDYDDHFEFLDQIWRENYFTVYDRFIQSEEYEFGLQYDNKKFDFTLSVEFSYVDPDNNLSIYKLRDKINLSEYIFIRKDYCEGNEFEEKEYLSSEQFLFLNNENISNLFNYHYGYYENDQTVMINENTFNPKFELLKLHDFSNVVSDWYNINYRNQSRDIISDKWKTLDKSDKQVFFEKVIRFCYLSNMLIPKILFSFLSYKHIPTTRQIPQKIYYLEGSNFNQKDYYGLLFILSEEFKSKKNSGTQINHIICNTSFESITKKINESYNFNNNEEWEGDLKLFIKSFYYNINKEVIKFGINNYYSIELEKDVGRIFLIGKDNLKISMSNASSGFIQVFPIIVLCKLIELQDVSRNKVDEFSYGFTNKEFDKRINDTEIIQKFHPFVFKSDLILNFNTLFIEQPELHLHPKLQSQLGVLFADSINNSKIEDSIFVETHSEHLIRKIQVLIANGELSKEKVSVLYFDNDQGTTKIKEMEIDENGLFKEDWPNGFFDDSINLTMELFDAIRKRKN